jgi:hypothetical protein
MLLGEALLYFILFSLVIVKEINFFLSKILWNIYHQIMLFVMIVLCSIMQLFVFVRNINLTFMFH